MTTIEILTRLAYLAAATCFVLGLHLMNSPASARRGNRLSAVGMLLAIVATGALLAESTTLTSTGLWVLVAGLAVGAAAGLYGARSAPTTAMPQLVSIFNAAGGGAAALIALDEVVRALSAATVPARMAAPAALDIIIGAVTLSGSLIASGKLHGVITGRPLVFRGARAVNALLGLVLLGTGGYLASGHTSAWAVVVLSLAALAFGVTMVLPIGGADMPVVISLLNAFTGTAVAMAGFVIGNSGLIIAGALVGASGTILTKLMADAMNRSIVNIVVGGFGAADSDGSAVTAGASVRELSVDDAAIQLAYASRVVIVPGYGLAAAQAQHAVHELAMMLAARGVDVSYAIHPVAGRMPGHMNVLLAEANVPYELMKDMDEANPDFARTDVALVVGANDIVNPAARRPGTAISGMPILDVDRATSVIVIKRSMGHGYAGIDNDLYTSAKTGMLFADAKAGLTALVAAVKTLVG
ncbi:MAG: NAD(P)(+) transhydrogenase (Re/Si-specific) subunit beta [Micromonosporaceae bacterium]